MAVDTFTAPTGTTQYVVIVRPADGFWYNTNLAAFETFTSGNYTDYDVAATEFGTTGIFQYTFPVITKGYYNVVSKTRAGGSPAQSDVTGAGGFVQWDGTNVLPLSFLSDQNVKTLAAVYDSAASNGTNTLTLSNGATQFINTLTGARTTT